LVDVVILRTGLEKETRWFDASYVERTQKVS
jgi:hypothetical protein